MSSPAGESNVSVLLLLMYCAEWIGWLGTWLIVVDPAFSQCDLWLWNVGMLERRTKTTRGEESAGPSPPFREQNSSYDIPVLEKKSISETIPRDIPLWVTQKNAKESRQNFTPKKKERYRTMTRSP